MHIDDKVVDAVGIGHLRPTGTVQHLDRQLVVVLYRLNDKVAAHIVALVGLVQKLDAIVIALDGRGLIWPKLCKVLWSTLGLVSQFDGKSNATYYIIQR